MVFFILFLILFVISYAGLTWFRPVLALQVLLFALPSYLIRFDAGIPMTLLEAMILISFGGWLIRSFGQIKAGLQNRWQNKSAAIEYPFAIEMVLVVAAGLVGVIVAGVSNEALGIWKAYFFEPVLLLIVIYNVIGKQPGTFAERFGKLLWPLVYSALGVSLLAIYQKATGNLIDNPAWSAEATRRVVSVFGYPNAVGLYLESIVMFAIGLLLVVRKDRKLSSILLLSVALSVLAVIFAKSVGTALGLAAGLSVFALLYSKRSRLAYCVIIMLIAAAIFSVPQSRSKAIKYLTLQDFSGQVRLIGWTESWKMLSDGRLLTGAGLSNFKRTVEPYHVPGFYYNWNNQPDFRTRLILFDQKYRDKYWQPLEIYMYPHNIVLNFWSEVGLFGLLVFFWLIMRFYRLAISALRKQGSGNKVHVNRIILIACVSAMTTMIAHGLVDVPFFKNDLAILFWLPIAVFGLYQLEQRMEALKDTEKSSRVVE